MKEEIIEFLRKNRKPLAPDVVARRMSLVKSQDYKVFLKELGALEREGKVIFLRSGEIRLKEEGPRLEGVFRANSRGFGFVTIDKDEPDVFIPRGKTRWALEGDKVEVEITRNGNALSGTSAEGNVAHILERGTTTLVGTFTPTADEGFIGILTSRNRKLTAPILVTGKGLVPQAGDLVRLDVTGYPQNKEGFITGLVTAIIGHTGETGIDVLEILASMDIKRAFPEPVERQVAEISDSVSADSLIGREDFRDEVTYTIDGADSKDLDDAIHVKKLVNGHFELGVHIADVSYYVTEGSALDLEALERGTSVYVTDRVVPMLPVALSNGICSLNPQVDRLTQSCIMEIDDKGRVVGYRIVPSVIKTTYRMTYDDVNLMIAGNLSALTAFPLIAESVKEAVSLHKILEAMRLRRGALDFETNEAKIVVDEKGLPLTIVKRTRGLAERMIESFMLAANETVAGEFVKRQLPAIYRIHEHPKEEKLRLFIDFAASAGFQFQGKVSQVANQDLQAFTRRIKGTPYEAVLSMMLLRSMQQARYSQENVGHFGLGAENYTHFTSPIRRYPDLLVHRLLREYRQVTQEKEQHYAAIIPEIAAQSSSRERRAVDAEREVTKIKSAEYMTQFVDQEFDGVISGVTSFGAFVELENTVEGLIATRNMKEFFNFNDRSLTLTAGKSGLTFKIGNPVRVKLVSADKATGEIDFLWIKSDKDSYEKQTKVNKKAHPHSSRKPAETKADHKDKVKKKSTGQPYYKKAKQSIGKGTGHGKVSKKRR